MTKNVNIPANMMKAYEIAMQQILESDSSVEEKLYAQEALVKLMSMNT